MIRRPPRSTLFPYTTPLPISSTGVASGAMTPVSSASDVMWVANILIEDRKSTRLNSSHGYISYAVLCLQKKCKQHITTRALRVSHLMLRLRVSRDDHVAVKP